ncbi:hypothetical protein D0865_03797 [Hortaea werneckii]|uniref:Uncharacterized protein n=1 Tax=Hortaea werneckii TaxID=91943 RepID=A0A3M7CVS5_HORWE|nr:hypothetical protein D0865_03797 [Hortaea werneckii]
MRGFFSCALSVLLYTTFAKSDEIKKGQGITSSCPSTVCAAYINTCSQMYGGCYAACSGFATPTFSPPPCITQPRQEHRFAGTSTSSCESTVCADYINIVVWYTIWLLLCGMLRLHQTKFHPTAVSDYNANIHAHSDAHD